VSAILRTLFSERAAKHVLLERVCPPYPSGNFAPVEIPLPVRPPPSSVFLYNTHRGPWRTILTVLPSVHFPNMIYYPARYNLRKALTVSRVVQGLVNPHLPSKKIMGELA